MIFLSNLLTRKDVAEKMGLSLPSVDRLIARDGFPVIRFGRSVKIPEELLDQWIRENVGQEVQLQ